MTCPDTNPHAAHFDERAQKPCGGIPLHPLGTKVADHITITPFMEHGTVCICIRGEEVELTVDEWAKVSVAGDLAAMQVRTRAATGMSERQSAEKDALVNEIAAVLSDHMSRGTSGRLIADYGVTVYSLAAEIARVIPSAKTDQDRTCSEHDVALIWEPGGDDMPTIHGRWYCPTCQEALMAALDAQPDRNITRA